MAKKRQSRSHFGTVEEPFFAPEQTNHLLKSFRMSTPIPKFCSDLCRSHLERQSITASLFLAIAVSELEEDSLDPLRCLECWWGAFAVQCIPGLNLGIDRPCSFMSSIQSPVFHHPLGWLANQGRNQTNPVFGLREYRCVLSFSNLSNLRTFNLTHSIPRDSSPNSLIIRLLHIRIDVR